MRDGLLVDMGDEVSHLDFALLECGTAWPVAATDSPEHARSIEGVSHVWASEGDPKA